MDLLKTPKENIFNKNSEKYEESGKLRSAKLQTCIFKNTRTIKISLSRQTLSLLCYRVTFAQRIGYHSH